MTDQPANTTYNVVDALIFLNPTLFDQLAEVWVPDQEQFIVRCGDFLHDCRMFRTVAYTYWHTIWFCKEAGYPLRFRK